jgi:periplasmic protein TonB
MQMVLSTLACVAVLVVAAPATQEIIYDPDKSITLPRVVKEVKPVYPPDAMGTGAQGEVHLRSVVSTGGRATEIEIVRSLEERLDRAAVVALQQWEFKPGAKAGKPVPVRITVEMRFSLK